MKNLKKTLITAAIVLLALIIILAIVDPNYIYDGEGEVISYDYTGAYVGTSKEDGEIFQEMEESYADLKEMVMNKMGRKSE